jgi:hypothetical protein
VKRNTRTAIIVLCLGAATCQQPSDRRSDTDLGGDADEADGDADVDTTWPDASPDSGVDADEASRDADEADLDADETDLDADETDLDADEDSPPVDCVVNGHTVDEPACGWLQHIARDVVPLLEGTRDERLDDASIVAWWSLKEGVLYLSNPVVYSNCNFTTGDARIGPLDVCPSGRAWQVGLAAVQVPNYSLSAVEATSTHLFPGRTIASVLEATAIEAGLDAASVDAVVASTGDLRKSWLLRTSAIGFTHQVGTVVAECIDGSRSWCFGTGWDTSRWFASDREAAMTSIEDIRAIFDALAP